MKSFFCLTFILILTMNALAKVYTESVEYKDGDVTLKGYLAYDDSLKGPLPGVLIFHEWWGLTEYPQHRAEQLAKAGYIAFCADMYGNGAVTKNADEAKSLVGPFYGDRAMTRKRAQAALDILKSQKLCNQKKIAAIGYCFGGTCALELARSGADLEGVVSFHGGLTTPDSSDAKKIKGKLLICHGADDPFVTWDDVATFQREMRNAKVDYEINAYSGAVHAFTNPASGNDPSKGMAYNMNADRRSWRAMMDFFNEIFR